jgi:hypothetical protein
MSKHTISHADQILAGDGLAVNAADPTHGMGGEDIGNVQRGIRLAMLVAETLQGGNSDQQAFCANQTPAAGGQQDLLINGNEAVDGVGNFTVCSVVSITSNGADGGRLFTVIGRDANGRPQAEEITGPATTTVFGTKTFTKIDRVFVDDDTAGVISVGEDETQPRGLRRRGLDWDVDYLGSFGASNVHIAWDAGGGIETAGSYSPGSATTQTATNSDQRARYTPVDQTGDIEVVYLADLSKGGVGENYLHSSQSDFSV